MYIPKLFRSSLLLATSSSSSSAHLLHLLHTALNSFKKLKVQCLGRSVREILHI